MSKEAMNLAQTWQQTDWNTESPMSADFAVSEAHNVINALMAALRTALADQPAQQEPVAQWHLAKDRLPPVGSEVIGGYFYKDTWLKGNPEVFAWGQCRVLADDHPDFPDGKRWHTFGPSHNQVTHWCWPPKKPGDTSPPAQRKPLTDEEILDANWVGNKAHITACPAPTAEGLIAFARAIEAAHGIKENT